MNGKTPVEVARESTSITAVDQTRRVAAVYHPH
jgi:hypothetical protein